MKNCEAKGEEWNKFIQKQNDVKIKRNSLS